MERDATWPIPTTRGVWARPGSTISWLCLGLLLLSSHPTFYGESKAVERAAKGAAVREMGVTGIDRIISLATSENLCLQERAQYMLILTAAVTMLLGIL